MKRAGLKSDGFVFPSRIHDSPHLETRQYASLLEGWVEELGLDPTDYGAHSMRRTRLHDGRSHWTVEQQQWTETDCTDLSVLILKHCLWVENILLLPLYLKLPQHRSGHDKTSRRRK